MVEITTEQELPFSFKVVDGRGRTVEVDGDPVAASSDDTVGTVTLEAGADGEWTGKITAVAPSPEGTTQRVTVTADADLGAGVQDVVGVLDFNVTLDPRTGARLISISPGTPVDKAVV